VNESFVVVIDFANDLFVIVIDFFIAILEKCLEMERIACVRRRAELAYVCRQADFFYFQKNTLVPGVYLLGQKVSAH